MDGDGFRPTTFAVSILFGTFAGIYLLGELTDLVVDLELALPVSIVAAGTAAMAAITAKAAWRPRRSEPVSAGDAASDAERELDDAIDIDALLSEDWRSIDELDEASSANEDVRIDTEPRNRAGPD